jgi:cytochrome c peroxidase
MTERVNCLLSPAWFTGLLRDLARVQAVGPIKNPIEMDMTLSEVAEWLEQDPAISKAFGQAYAEAASESTSRARWPRSGAAW